MRKPGVTKSSSLSKLGKHEEAIQAYDEAIRLDPEDAEAWSNKASSLSELGKHEEAIQAYDEAIKLNPELAEAWNNKGIALNTLGRCDEAVRAFDKARELGWEEGSKSTETPHFGLGHNKK